MAGKTNSSITNVAALANVSIATVSRVLSGKRDKDDDIARRVRAAAEQLNYSVNYAATSPTPSAWSSPAPRTHSAPNCSTKSNTPATPTNSS